MSSQPNLELSALHVCEFAVPKHPVRHKMRSSSIEPGKSSSPMNSTELLKEGQTGAVPPPPTPPTPPQLIPEKENASTVQLMAAVEPVVGNVEPQPVAEGAEPYTEIKTIRKRGRKPKVVDVTETSSDGSQVTPRKKGRRGRPPASDGTPAKENVDRTTPEPAKRNEPDQQLDHQTSVASGSGTGDDLPPSSSQIGNKSALEAALEWGDFRTRTIGIGKQ